jgi:hypothetical protein
MKTTQTVKTTKTVKTKKTNELKLSTHLLVHGLSNCYPLIDSFKEIDGNIISMSIKIPGGGDYSNMSLDVDGLVLEVVTEKTEIFEIANT